MAIIPHNTKVLSLSPVAYYDFSEASGNLSDQGSANTDLVGSGTPDYQEPSLLKDGSDYAVGISSGSFISTDGITTSGGYSISCIIQINSFPSGTMYPITVGNPTSFEPYFQLGFWIGGGGLKGFRLGCGRSTGPGWTQDEFGNLVLGKKYHLVVTVTSTTIRAYLDGAAVFLHSGYSGILPFTDDGMSISTTGGAEYTIDEFSLYSGALSNSEVDELFRSVRAIDEDATSFFVAVDGDDYGTGTFEDPLTIEASTVFPVTLGGELILRGGDYVPTYPIVWYFGGTEENRVTIRAHTGEHVRIIHTHQGLVTGLAGNYLDIIGQQYAIEDGVAGIELLNPRTSRFGWKGNYPELEELIEGTVNGTNLVTEADDTWFHGPSHDGLVIRILDGSNAILHETTIASVTNFKELEMTDSFAGGEQELSSSLKVKVYGSGGFRYEGGGIRDYGQDNRIIGMHVHDVGDGVTSFVSSHRTQIWYGLFTNLGWTEANFRDHAHTTYFQNSVSNGYKECNGIVTFECGGSTGKFDSASGDADNFKIHRHISAGAGEHEDCMFFDLFSYMGGTGSISADSNTLTYTASIGALVVGARVRIKGAGWFGTNLFALVQAVDGSTVTLSQVARTTVSGVEVKSWGIFSAHSDGLFTGSSNATLPSYNHIVTECVNLRPNDGRLFNELTIGYSVNNENCEVRDCYSEGGLYLNYWRQAIVTNNDVSEEFHPNTDKWSIGLTKRSDISDFDWANTDIDHNNTRAVNYPLFSGLVYPFRLSGVLNQWSGVGLPFYDASNPTLDWQDTTGTDGKYVDVNGTFNDSSVWDDNRYFIHPQDPAVGILGAANIVLLNREHLTSMDVDLTPCGLVDGQRFQIRDAELYTAPYGVIYDGYYDEGNPIISIPICEQDTVANFASLPSTGEFGIAYKTDDDDKYWRWGTDGDYHEVKNPIPRLQPVGWTESEFSDLNSYKPERLMAKLLPYEFEGGPVTTSYSNPDGSGDRRGGTLTVTPRLSGGSVGGVGGTGDPYDAWIDGDTADQTDWFLPTLYFLEFDFSVPRVIDEAKFYQDLSTSHGTWQWQGSNNGSSWTDLGSNFELGGTPTQTLTELNGNTTAYRYYRIASQSGESNNLPWIHEFEFKIDGGEGSSDETLYTDYINISFNQTTTRTQTGVARIQKTATQTQIGVARIQKTVVQTQTGVSRIQVTTARTQTGVSRITASTQRTQTGKAAIRNTTTQTQLGVSRITASTTRTQTGKAAVQNTTTRTQDGVANIVVTSATSQTQFGKAAIQNTTTRNQNGVSRIQIATTRNQNGVSAIQSTTTRNQNGISRITNFSQQNQTGKAAIRKTTTQIQLGVSRIQKSVSVTQLGVSRIQKSVTHNQSGVARITATTTQSQIGVARIIKTISQVQTGVARITVSTTRNQTGVAKILIPGTFSDTIRDITYSVLETDGTLNSDIITNGTLGSDLLTNATLFSDIINSVNTTSDLVEDASLMSAFIQDASLISDLVDNGSNESDIQNI